MVSIKSGLAAISFHGILIGRFSNWVVMVPPWAQWFNMVSSKGTLLPAVLISPNTPNMGDCWPPNSIPRCRAAYPDLHGAMKIKMFNKRIRRTYNPRLRNRLHPNLTMISPPLTVTGIAGGGRNESGAELAGSCSSTGLSDTMITLQIVRLAVD